MKTKVEINGYEIAIEEIDGRISVTATFEDEVVEEFQIEMEEGSEGSEEDNEVQGFDEFGQDEEEDFGQDEEEDDDFGQDDEEEDDEEESHLESFQSFLNKKK
jgi:hypothetical protein